MAERTKFSAYCCYSAAISLIVYPISGHWIWGGGWLAQLGFHDFAGSTAVHFVGGVTACLGAWMLGPRIGKYSKDGKARAIQMCIRDRYRRISAKMPAAIAAAISPPPPTAQGMAVVNNIFVK